MSVSGIKDEVENEFGDVPHRAEPKVFIFAVSELQTDVGVSVVLQCFCRCLFCCSHVWCASISEIVVCVTHCAIPARYFCALQMWCSVLCDVFIGTIRLLYQTVWVVCVKFVASTGSVVLVEFGVRLPLHISKLTLVAL